MRTVLHPFIDPGTVRTGSCPFLFPFLLPMTIPPAVVMVGGEGREVQGSKCFEHICSVVAMGEKVVFNDSS